MKSIKYEHRAIPTYALSSLINGDDSGMSKQDIEDMNEFLAPYQAQALELKGSIHVVPENEQEYFYGFPAFGLATNCTDCTIVILHP